MTSVEELIDVLATNGDGWYGGEAVTQLEHALQCARLAEESGAPSALIVAALFHDIGHLIHSLGENVMTRGKDDWHEDRGSAALAGWFGPEVTEPVRLHVAAKRYLCATEPGYFVRLSPASVRSLELQGGPFTPAEAAAFIAQPAAAAAVAVRRWDDRAKTRGLVTPPLAHYRGHIDAALV